MKLNGFIGSCLGLVGFAVSILAGLHADNEFGTVLIRAVLAALGCYVIGYGVGYIAGFVAKEHAERLADEVAKKDAEDAAKRARLAAETAAEMRGANAAEAIPAGGA